MPSALAGGAVSSPPGSLERTSFSGSGSCASASSVKRSACVLVSAVSINPFSKISMVRPTLVLVSLNASNVIIN